MTIHLQLYRMKNERLYYLKTILFVLTQNLFAPTSNYHTDCYFWMGNIIDQEKKVEIACVVHP